MTTSGLNTQCDINTFTHTVGRVRTQGMPILIFLLRNAVRLFSVECVFPDPRGAEGATSWGTRPHQDREPNQQQKDQSVWLVELDEEGGYVKRNAARSPHAITKPLGACPYNGAK